MTLVRGSDFLRQFVDVVEVVIINKKISANLAIKEM
jgi:hypothetical protein